MHFVMWTQNAPQAHAKNALFQCKPPIEIWNHGVGILTDWALKVDCFVVDQLDDF